MSPQQAAAEYKRTHRQYVFHWRSGGQQTITGEAEAAASLGVTPATLRVYLSNGRAAKGWETVNPEGAIDHLTIEALPPPRLSKPDKKPRGRPRINDVSKSVNPPGRPRKDLGPVDTDSTELVDWTAVRAKHRR